MDNQPKTTAPRRDKSVAVVGSGGNIGSFLVALLARLPSIGTVTLVDPDFYDFRNCENQNIFRDDIGLAKVAAQARLLQRIAPHLIVVPIAAPVARVPLGALRADVIVSCLDSRSARMDVNSIAWRLGTPWIDAGVLEGEDRLARVTLYFPGSEGSACVECAWSQEDYDQVEQEYPCRHGAAPGYRTGAPAGLGSLAASLQVLELGRLLDGGLETPGTSRTLVFDANRHRALVSELRRNPQCRFPDHEVWSIERLGLDPELSTLEEVLRLGPDDDGDRRALRVEGSHFVSRLICQECGESRAMLRLEASLGPEQTRCSNCGERMVATGMGNLEELRRGSVEDSTLTKPLAALGIRADEVVSIGVGSEERHYQIGGHGGA